MKVPAVFVIRVEERATQTFRLTSQLICGSELADSFPEVCRHIRRHILVCLTSAGRPDRAEICDVRLGS